MAFIGLRDLHSLHGLHWPLFVLMTSIWPPRPLLASTASNLYQWPPLPSAVSIVLQSPLASTASIAWPLFVSIEPFKPFEPFELL